MEGLEKEENVDSINNGDDFEKNLQSDPLIYQLVRVEGDGTMIPATEDEVMQFEHLFDGDKEVDLPSVENLDLGNMESFLSAEVKSELEEGFSKPMNKDIDGENLNTALEFDETKNTGSPNDTSIEPSNTHPNETERTDSTSPAANDSAPPAPNFYLFQEDEICLDGLSIRELQELFLATFGRQTNVKDKCWLKRRIAMGITNSSEVPTSNFIIKNNKIVIKETGIAQEEGNRIQCKSPSHSFDSKESTRKRSRTSNNLEQDGNNSEEDAGTGTGDATGTSMPKRMRKPTKRYIEELSDLESKDMSAKIGSSDRRHVRSRVRIAPEIGSWGPALRTRSDSLGGFRVQVPFTSRARRCRPRKNLISFMKTQNVLFGKDENMVKEGEEREAVLVRKTVTPSLNIPKPKQEEEEDEATTEDVKSEIPEAELDQSEGENTNSDEGTNNKSGNMSGGSGGRTRRKHHRAWTLCEVLKLVEGVSRYGAGRWSEIKRLVFASYSYRTSVDLKDKWRNLLKASLAQPSTEREGKNARKPASMPIPKSILSRVRELAELHSQTGTEFPGTKFPGNKILTVNGDKVVQGKGSGFL